MTRAVALAILFAAAGGILIPLTASLPAQEAEGKKYALLIGVKKYGEGTGLRDLDCAEKDVSDLAAVLEKHGYAVTVLTRAESIGKDKDFLMPTAENIGDQLNGVMKGRKSGDTVLVAFSGHGAHLKETDKLYFCPTGTKLGKPATLVCVDDVLAKFKDCNAGSKVLLFDACRNDPADGRAVGTPGEIKSSTRPLIPDPPGGTVALFSCSKGEISHESKALGRGFLFHHVIEGLSGKAASKTGEVTWQRLTLYVTEELPEAVRKEKGPNVTQTPEVRGEARAMVLAKSVGRRGGDVVKFEIADGAFMEFCWIPGGKCQLGSPEEERETLAKRMKQDKVAPGLASEAEAVRGAYATAGFWLGRYEVTQGEWTAVMKSNPSHFAKSKRPDLNDHDTDRFPVESVSWNDCQQFLKAIRGRRGAPELFGVKGVFRLPHEDEWEYACRGGMGNKRPYYWGDTITLSHANCDKTFSSEPGQNFNRTRAVGSYEKDCPHPWRLCDMTGNVFELCDNTFDGSEDWRVSRGGSFGNSGLIGCRTAYRRKEGSDKKSFGVGFRVAYCPG